MGDYVVKPLSAETWGAFAGLVERHNGIFGGCWCTWFHTLGADKDPNRTYESNRDLKRRLVEEGRARAAVVLDGDEAVAWAQYGTPEQLPNLHHRKQYEAEADLVPDYRITCIFVDKRHRRRGVTAIALQGAVDRIAAVGGGVVEGYPHEIAPDARRLSSSFLYNGTRAVYERAGFEYIRSKGMKNCVMRRTVGAGVPAG